MDLPEPEYAVEGIFAQGLNLFSGRPKQGKSWLMLWTALAIADGFEVLGVIPVVKGTVLYLALEDTRRRLKERIGKLLQGRPFPANLHLAREWPRQHEGGLEALEEWIITHKNVRMVIVDTLQKFRPPQLRGGSVYQTDYDHLGALKALADKTNTCFVAIHHTRKSETLDPHEDVSGSHGVSGAADASIVLRRERGQHDACLHITGRDVEERELALQWDSLTCRWKIVGNAEEFRITKERAAIIALLVEVGKPMTPAMVADATGKNRNAMKVLLWRMANEGLIHPVGDGSYQTSNHSNRVTSVTGATTVTGRLPSDEDAVTGTVTDPDLGNCPFR
jgi:hypothetical protein